MRQYIISLLSIVCISIPGNIALAASTEVIEDSLIIEDNYLLTAYYSPLSDQSKYFRGSFEADKRLNGQGTHAADGTPVYFGMIAASPDIPYGSKVYIPGIGLCTAHDRGSAIQ
ncbi:MAG: 3D domain-containing protein [Patescibacteria group bacterium]|nr:3D domain-containing protein [Patescibacteria group bacterium]